MLLYPDGLVLARRWTRSDHGNGLIALRLLRLLLDRLNRLELVLLLHVLLLVHLLRMLIDVALVDALVVARGRRRRILHTYRRLDVVHDSLVSGEL